MGAEDVPAFEAAQRELVGISWSTMECTSNRPLQEALRCRLRELAARHVRRLTVLLHREGWMVNAKAGLPSIRPGKPEGAQCGADEDRTPTMCCTRASRWSEPVLVGRFCHDKLTDGRSYRILTVIDQFTRERVVLKQTGLYMGGMWLLR